MQYSGLERKVIKVWEFKQRLSLRASTMLLLFTAMITALGLSDYLFGMFVEFFPERGALLWRFGVNIDNYAVIAAFIALVFFAHSLAKKNPQGQFVLEIILCLIIYLFV